MVGDDTLDTKNSELILRRCLYTHYDDIHGSEKEEQVQFRISFIREVIGVYGYDWPVKRCVFNALHLS